jgi:hypothetical protein
LPPIKLYHYGTVIAAVSNNFAPTVTAFGYVGVCTNIVIDVSRELDLVTTYVFV